MSHVIIWNSISSGPTRPLGPHQLASWLRAHGYSTKVIDFCSSMSTNDLVAITNKHVDDRTIAVGVSTTFMENENWPPVLGYKHQLPAWVTSAKAAIELVNPGIRWIHGGAKSYEYDLPGWHRLTGHAEDSFLSWLDQESQHLGVTRDSFDIKLASRCYADDDAIEPSEVLPIELGRGCMFRCKFCAYDLIGKTPGTYLRDFDLVRREILDHHERWGTTRFYYVDDTVNESMEKMEALAAIAESMPFRLEWIGYVRADLVWSNPGMKELLVRSGLRSAFFGIESFEENSSKLVGKGWSGKHGKQWLLDRRREWGTDITWQLGLVVGLSGQTPSQLRDDSAWLIDNDMHNWKHFPLWLEPGTYQSEFSINSAKYGFSFPHPDKPWFWQNGDWDFQKAYDSYVELEAMSSKKVRLGAWTLGEVASLGYQIDDIIPTYKRDIPWPEIKKLRDDMVGRYVRSQLR